MVETLKAGLFLLAATLWTLPAGASPAVGVPRMVLVEGGTFLQGSAEAQYAANERVHAVTLSPFLIAETETPQKLWTAVMGSNPSKFRGDDRPVEFVSWMDAVRFCNALSEREGLENAYAIASGEVTWNRAANGYRLPTEAEWEYAAQASETKPDGKDDKNYLQKIYDWYSTPTPNEISRVGSKGKNYWGVYDLHGLIWEWNQDFSSSLVTGESRGNNGLEKNLFCGSGSVGAKDFKNYPAFMRFAFRSSLKANYTTANLGFRCVKDLENKRGKK